MTFNLLKEICKLRNEKYKLLQDSGYSSAKLNSLELKLYKLNNKYISETKKQGFKYLV
jgi:hypothetical protein